MGFWGESDWLCAKEKKCKHWKSLFGGTHTERAEMNFKVEEK